MVPMVRFTRSAAVLTLTMVLASPAMVWAQDPVPSFDLLRLRLKAGDTVYVTEATGAEVKGKVESLEASALRLAGNSRLYGAADVRLIEERRPDALGNGALIGLGVGAGSGAILMLASWGDEFEAHDVGPFLLLTGFWGAMGAGIGALVDMARPGPKSVVYRHPGSASASASRVRVAPVLGRTRRGVAVSIRF